MKVYFRISPLNPQHSKKYCWYHHHLRSALVFPVFNPSLTWVMHGNPTFFPSSNEGAKANQLQKSNLSYQVFLSCRNWPPTQFNPLHFSWNWNKLTTNWSDAFAVKFTAQVNFFLQFFLQTLTTRSNPFLTTKLSWLGNHYFKPITDNRCDYHALRWSRCTASWIRRECPGRND